MFLNSPSATTMWHSSQPLNAPGAQGAGLENGNVDTFNVQFQRVAAASSATVGGAHPTGRQNPNNLLAPPSYERSTQRGYPYQSERRSVIATPRPVRATPAVDIPSVSANTRRALEQLRANNVQVTEYIPATINDENDRNLINLLLAGPAWQQGGTR